MHVRGRTAQHALWQLIRHVSSSISSCHVVILRTLCWQSISALLVMDKVELAGVVQKALRAAGSALATFSQGFLHAIKLSELRRRIMSEPLVMDEAELPEVLREALRAAREREADKRARRARGEAPDDDEDDDDDEEFEVRLNAAVNQAGAYQSGRCHCYTNRCIIQCKKDNYS